MKKRNWLRLRIRENRQKPRKMEGKAVGDKGKKDKGKKEAKKAKKGTKKAVKKDKDIKK